MIREPEPIKTGEPLPGRYYLWVKLKDDKCKGRGGRIRIRKPRNCAHGITICTECMESWGIDYNIDFESTEGGRKLRQEGNPHVRTQATHR
ncbi:hypothetical protein PBI_ASERPROCKY_88 [Gordonia phage ASerpRocky]|uniref:Uncharacterized protein n=1 Tax=Gordonia phage ASerpRocky TaxID=2599841 RepID=A0A5J6TDV6_9CAUD|nr:hypothetical protein PBI_ASERPROCKY_88 [Gordonia phage ASerpRocky]